MQTQYTRINGEESLIQAKRVAERPRDGVFFYLLLLTAFFFLLEVSFFIQCNQVYFEDYTFVSDHLAIPRSIVPGILYFIGAQLFVHLLYCFSIWLITILVANSRSSFKEQQFNLSIFFWLLGIITIITANYHYFPNSKFSELASIVLNPTIAENLLKIFACFWGLIAIIATIGCIQLLRHYKALFIGTSVVLLTGGIFYYWPPIKLVNGATRDKPNIIIVGVDSLRPDYLRYFGGDKPTPFIDAFLAHATVYSDAVTPLARTFPSWSGILSGRYPKQFGVRYNLADQKSLDFSETLPSILKRTGYDTLYASDETRFSNVDKQFGFDEVITPPMGLNDFLLGTFNDFPLSNLIVNTLLGKYLFPHSYGNRPVYFTYDPNTFLKLIQPGICKTREHPLFLAIHFCLPHYPYVWAQLPLENNYKAPIRYQKSIERVDQQLRDFFSMLAQAHLLDHAIVILLSDHGEALEMTGDRITDEKFFIPGSHPKKTIPRFYPPSLDTEGFNQSAGHGTDVLGITQYHPVLALRSFGAFEQHPQMITGIVSLIDIKPTILQLLKIGNATDTLPLTRSNANKHRHFFFESDFSPEAIHTVYPETRDVMLEGIQLFKVDPTTTKLLVQAKMGRMIIKSKQYADIYGDWMLALYPQNQHTRAAILVNLVSGRWTNDLESPLGKKAPVKEMYEALKVFYGDEIR